MRVQPERVRPFGAPDLAATLRQAASLHAGGGLAQAQLAYRNVLRRQPQNFDALHMLGVIALQSGQVHQGIALIEEALRLKPDHARALANLGNGYSLVNRPEEALRSYDRALLCDAGFAGVISNRGNVLQSLGRYDEAAEAFRRLLELAPKFEFALGNFFHSRRHVCDWRDFSQHVEHVVSALQAGRCVDRPFSFLSVSDSAALQWECARIYGSSLCSTAAPALWRGEHYGHTRIRVAYVSADFRDHVVANLMAPLYERHDRHQFEIIGVSLTADDGSEIAARTRRALGSIIDASRLNDQEVAQRLRGLEVDIAVDLTGYTQGCRPGIFARRPAPVQVNFLGFPGTMGLPWLDYILADDFVIPESHGDKYAEKVARMPDSFQANDERRLLAAEVPTPARAAVGLPTDGVVLCSFCNSYKLNPDCFSIWMLVMSRARDSVLWLLGNTPAVERHLRGEAASRGIAPERLVFAQRLPYPQHLARLRLADLFLDTLPFNAGATASDALWAGVPLLTCAGEAFAARMAGSVLRAIGMPELIATDLSHYERLATELTADPNRLSELKSKLANNRATFPLFDGERYCRHLEDAYRQMWQRAEHGDAPASFLVPARSDLHHLD